MCKPDAADQPLFCIPGLDGVIDAARQPGVHAPQKATNHYDPRMERQRGQLPVMDLDLACLGDVVREPEYVVFGTKNRLGRHQIAYVKRMPEGSLLYLEEIRTKRRELAAVSLRKYPATMNADTLVSTLHPNAHGDGGHALILVLRGLKNKGTPEPVGQEAEAFGAMMCSEVSRQITRK